MKIITIAMKDLTRSFRSVFAVVFMFVIPLLVTLMFYIMFGGMKSSDNEISLPQTRVVIANLDAGGAGFQMASAQLQPGSAEDSIGDLLVQALENEALADLLQVSQVGSAEAARAAVDTGNAGVAIIIPQDFSARFSDINSQAVLELYQDPTLTIGPAILRTVLNQALDQLSGTRIAVSVALTQGGSADPATIGQVVQEFLAASSQYTDPNVLLNVHPPAGVQSQEVPLLLRIIGPIMGGMLVFYAFYTATASAESLLQEDEKGTLQRIFTTPTPQSSVLAGKLLAVLLTVSIQVSVLLLAGRLIFNIHWGDASAVMMFSLGTILCASSFGVFVNSMMKNTRQGGIVFGGVLTFSGMIGMLPIFTFNNPSATLTTISLIVPQGWAVHNLSQSMLGAPSASLLTGLLVMIAWSAVFFGVGVWRFQHRFA